MNDEIRKNLEGKSRVYLVKGKARVAQSRTFRKLRGIATVKLTTKGIMSLTRGAK
jgi:hypothetical protein